MKASVLFVRCLENEGFEHVFRIPGEENLDLLHFLARSDSKLSLVTNSRRG